MQGTVSILPLYNIKDYVKGSGKIKIPAKTAKNVQIELTMPDSNFEGLVAGGITFKHDSSQIEFQGWNSRVNHSKKELNMFFRFLSKKSKYPLQHVK